MVDENEEEILVELEDEEVIENDEKEVEQEEKEEPKLVKDEDDDDEDKPKGSRAQKRIRGLVKQKKELETGLGERDRQIAELRKKLENVESTHNEVVKSAAEDMKTHIEQEMESLDEAWRQAFSEGDADKAAKLQRRMFQLESDKRDLERSERAAPKADKKTDGDDATPTNQNIDPDYLAYHNMQVAKWLKKNPWFLEDNDDYDEDKAVRAREISDELIHVKKIDPASNAYYVQLDDALSAEFEREPEKDEKPRRRTIVAGGSRDQGTSKKKKSVKLTQRQLQFAKDNGLTVEEMARSVAKQQANS